MSYRVVSVWVSGILVVLAAAQVPAAASASANVGPARAQSAAATSATAEFNRIVDAAWEYDLAANPLRASSLGDRRWNDRWSDERLEAIAARRAHDDAVLADVRRIDRTRLNDADRLNYDLFEREYATRAESARFHFYLLPVSQRGGIQAPSDYVAITPFESVKDYEDWLARMKAFPGYAAQVRALMRRGIEERFVMPRAISERIPKQIDAQIVDDPTRSAFYQPFTRFPDSVPAADRERLAAEARRVIASAIVPAYREFRDFFANAYLPASFDKVGAWQLPDGEALYANRARLFTTTSMTPREIHETGLREVARIRGEMEKVIRQVGFKGTFAEFLEFLRTDPRFYYKTPEELLDAYRAISKRIDPELVRVFKTLPRSPYGVIPIPASIAPDTTTAYYNPPAADGSRPGYYYVNLYKPEARPKYEMMALSLHESVPGHHLQIARAMELGEIPNFRRYGGYTAYVEGWGLYAESLGDDMKLYDDPYAKFGQLTYEMWRAVRLVVDTGIHAFRWDRRRAIDFFMENAAKQRLDVENEVDRYIAWPGQALAYKVGELKIKELRARAAARLGTRFDLREFHEVVLGSGALPLDLLERTVDAWTAERASAAGSDATATPPISR